MISLFRSIRLHFCTKKDLKKVFPMCEAILRYVFQQNVWERNSSFKSKCFIFWWLGNAIIVASPMPHSGCIAHYLIEGFIKKWNMYSITSDSIEVTFWVSLFASSSEVTKSGLSSGLLVDWLEHLDPEVTSVCPDLQQKLLFALNRVR